MNVNGFIINSIFPLWVVLSVSVLLLFFFIRKEIQRKQRYLIIRVVAQSVIILSLIALMVRPAIKKEKTSGSALLLTRGYDKKIADSLVDKYSLRTIRFSNAASYPQSKVIEQFNSLEADANDIQFVVGEGISPSMLDEFDLHFNYVNDFLPTGITRLKLEPLKANQQGFIQGEFNLTSEAVRLVLTGPGGVEDSIQLKGKGIVPFSLAVNPKQAGKFIYQLTIIEKANTSFTENLPVIVLPEKKLNVLFLQQYPTFETRYLKNYLSEKGHALTLRYQVSKNTYRYEYANREKQLIAKLNSELLHKTDLIVITPESLKELNQSELKSLEASVKEGLGVILLFTQPTKNISSIFPHLFTPVSTDTVTLTSFQWKGKLILPAMPQRIDASPFIQTLFADKEGRPLSGYFYNGAGRVGFQFLNETYRLSLEGKAKEYASLWSPLIEGTVRQDVSNYKIRLTTAFPLYAEQPIHFEVIAPSENPELHADSIRVPLAEDISVNGIWKGVTWATKAGWHKLTLQDSTQLDYYVSDNDEWKSLRQMNQIKQNKTYTARGDAKHSIVEEYQPLSPILFFIFFVLASGVLWLVAKI